MKHPGKPPGAPPPAVGEVEKGAVPVLDLRLYVAGQTPRSVAALANLRQICKSYLPAEIRVEVIDLIAHPELARRDQIVAIPTLVRKLPEPVRRIIGDLSQTERVLVGLDMRGRS